MIRLRSLFSCAVVALAVVVSACDKGGVYHYGVLTDVVNSLGNSSSVFLRSTTVGTDILIVQALDPTTVAEASEGKLMLFGSVDRDSSTTLRYGTYELDRNGRGVHHVLATYTFAYQPSIAIAGRDGAFRDDSAYDVDIRIERAGSRYEFEAFGNVQRLTPLDDALDNIDPNTAEGMESLFQVYNLALFFSQVRVPAFGGLGMTRYVAAPGTFDGLVEGRFVVSVASLFQPTATLDYMMMQDFPGVLVNGPQVTDVNTSGDGDMRGVLTFEIRSARDVTDLRFAGSVDYDDIRIGNGIAAGGTYAISITTPVTNSATLPYTLAANVDLTDILPIDP